MSIANISRRGFMAAGGGLLAAGCLASGTHAAMPRRSSRRFALNPATVRGYKLGLKEQVRLAIEAGYDGIEPWLADVQKAKATGELGDIKAMCADGNLKIVDGIGFARWSLPDDTARAKGLEEMKRDMGLMAELDCPFIAAPPFGLQKPGTPKVPLEDFIPRYRAVLELGDRMGVTPILEFWGHSANLSRLNEALFVASASGHPKAAVLADVYHMYRGGSAFEGLRFLSPSTLPILHMNDFPAQPAREKLTDADRVWPGDGCADWKQICGILRAGSLSPWLSLELFNPAYWKTTPLETLKTGLEKMKKVTCSGENDNA
ncbi:MAG: sugar phosphate isomerase/epimerase [Kiritimatiellae bacterium]|nr:sugar phosphate isomerase/epimerase [Kiritimatiellia bacterium]